MKTEPTTKIVHWTVCQPVGRYRASMAINRLTGCFDNEEMEQLLTIGTVTEALLHCSPHCFLHPC